jgi:SPP1 family predicted phage head-tail adaptor
MMRHRKNTCSRLRQRVTLQEETQTSDGAGGYVRGWQDIADLWAEIISLNGKEKLFAGQLQSQVSHKILLRYRNDVRAGQRLLLENRAFNIRYLFNVDEQNETIELLAEEGVAT